MIKGIVFDFGGVMTTSSMPMRLKRATEELGLPWEPFAEGFRKYRLDYDQGVKTLPEMYDLILGDAKLDLAPEARRRIEEADTASWLYRNERTLEWMRGLEKRGFKIGILTNMAPAFAPLFREHFADFVALADAVVVSGEERLVKPMPEIYALLAKRIALKPGELCFVDDLELNCAAARDCGWHAVRFAGNEQTERALEEELAK